MRRSLGFKLGTCGTPAAEEDVTYGSDAHDRLGTVAADFGNAGSRRPTTDCYTPNSNLPPLSTFTSGNDEAGVFSPPR